MEPDDTSFAPLSPPAQEAIRLYPRLASLVQLQRTPSTPRWFFIPVTRNGETELLTGHRMWLPEGWTDVLAIRGELDARAFRYDPDGGEVAKWEGSLTDVMNGLRDCPAPHEPGAPRLVKGRCHHPLLPSRLS